MSACEDPQLACASAGLSCSPMGEHTVGPPAENLGSRDFWSVERRREDLVPGLEGGSVGARPSGLLSAVPTQPCRSPRGPGQKRARRSQSVSPREKQAGCVIRTVSDVGLWRSWGPGAAASERTEWWGWAQASRFPLPLLLSCRLGQFSTLPPEQVTGWPWWKTPPSSREMSSGAVARAWSSTLASRSAFPLCVEQVEGHPLATWGDENLKIGDGL